jgi:hypothetical protein
LLQRGKCQDFFIFCSFRTVSELKVQQDETPQPPPLKRGEEEDEEWSPPGAQQKDDIFFLTSPEPQSGQEVSFSEEPTRCNTAKILLHFVH